MVYYKHKDEHNLLNLLKKKEKKNKRRLNTDVTFYVMFMEI